jgi:hypothetical protein
MTEFLENVKPKRLVLSRRKGFSLKGLSRDLNGLEVVKVDRSTKWGNPFVHGQPAPFGPNKGELVVDRRHAFVLFRSLAPLNVPLMTAAQSELRGKNLACWCDQNDPYEDTCHAAVLLQIANAKPESVTEPKF